MSSHFQSSQYGGSHYLSSHFGRAAIAPAPRKNKGGSGGPGVGSWKRSYPVAEPRNEDDEVIMAVIAAFLEMDD